MKAIGILLIANTASIILALGSVFCLVNEIDGWGWLLFGCIITGSTSVKWRSEDSENDLKS